MTTQNREDAVRLILDVLRDCKRQERCLHRLANGKYAVSLAHPSSPPEGQFIQFVRVPAITGNVSDEELLSLADGLLRLAEATGH